MKRPERLCFHFIIFKIDITHSSKNTLVELPLNNLRTVNQRTAMNKLHIRILTLLLLPGMAYSQSQDDFKDHRHRMVTQQLEARDITDEATLNAMHSVPRHDFVPAAHRARAYLDQPIPIGHGQTISQPYIVAYMTQLLNLEPGQRALEIGAGSGYQAAILAEIIDDVYTIEIIEELAEFGKNNLRRNGYDNVQVKHADGYYGWEEHAPFDAIVVTAASPNIPSPLIDQLKDGGVMVIPVGHPMQTQQLMLVRKDGDDITTEGLMPVRFVPFERKD